MTPDICKRNLGEKEGIWFHGNLVGVNELEPLAISAGEPDAEKSNAAAVVPDVPGVPAEVRRELANSYARMATAKKKSDKGNRGKRALGTPSVDSNDKTEALFVQME